MSEHHTYQENLDIIANIWIQRQIQKKAENKKEIGGLARHRVAYKKKCRKQGKPLPAVLANAPSLNNFYSRFLERSVTKKLGIHPGPVA